MLDRQLNRSLRMSLSVSSLFEKLSSYDSPMCKIPKRSYEKVSTLASSSQDIVNKISDEINTEFTRCLQK